MDKQRDRGSDPLKQIVAWIVAGQTDANITEAIAATWPDAKAQPLIAAAIQELSDAGEPDAQLIRGFAIEGTREVYRKCVEVGDHQTALRALRQIVELCDVQ